MYCVVGVGGADRAAGAVGVQETTRPLLIVEQIVQRVRRRPDRRAVAGVGRAGGPSSKEGAAQVAQVLQIAARLAVGISAQECARDFLLQFFDGLPLYQVKVGVDVMPVRSDSAV